jgi:hypothetical protein
LAPQYPSDYSSVLPQQSIGAGALGPQYPRDDSSVPPQAQFASVGGNHSPPTLLTTPFSNTPSSPATHSPFFGLDALLPLDIDNAVVASLDATFNLHENTPLDATAGTDEPLTDDAMKRMVLRSLETMQENKIAWSLKFDGKVRTILAADDPVCPPVTHLHSLTNHKSVKQVFDLYDSTEAAPGFASVGAASEAFGGAGWTKLCSTEKTKRTAAYKNVLNIVNIHAYIRAFVVKQSCTELEACNTLQAHVVAASNAANDGHAPGKPWTCKRFMDSPAWAPLRAATVDVPAAAKAGMKKRKASPSISGRLSPAAGSAASTG